MSRDQGLETGGVFQIDRHGDVLVIVASEGLETIDPTLIDDGAAELILGPIRGLAEPMVVFDLERVSYFGSTFLALLIRCWKVVSTRNGQLVLAGVSGRARELLQMTSLDLILPMYPTRREAIESLEAE